MSEMEIAPPVEDNRFLGLLLGIIVKPRATYAAIKESGRRTWLIVALLIALSVILLPIVAGPITAQRTQEAIAAVQEQQAERSPPGASGAVVVEESPVPQPSMSIFTTVFPAVGGLIGLIVAWLVWSGSIHLLSLMSGGRNTFGQMFQAVVWAWIPFAIRNFIQTIYIATTGTLIENPGLSGFARPSGPADILPFAQPEPGQLFLQSFLGKIDIYLFWNLALLVVGVTVMAKVSHRKALGIVLVVWAVLTFLSLLPSLVLGGFASSAF